MRLLAIILLTIMSPVSLFAQSADDGAGQGGATDAPNASGTASAKWAFEQGQRFQVDLRKEATVTTKVDTRIRIVEVETVLMFEWEVLDVDDEVATVQQTLKQIRVSSGAPGDVSGNRLSFDSAKKIYRKGISGKVAKQYQPLVGLAGQFKMESSGAIRDWKFADDQIDRLKKIPEDSPLFGFFRAGGVESLSGSTDLNALNRLATAGGDNGDGGDVGTEKARFDFDASAGFLKSSNRTNIIKKTTQYRDMKVNTTTMIATNFKMKEQK